MDAQTEVNKSRQDIQCAVVVVDVWQQQSEPDLYLAVIEEILGHRQYWWPYGWLLYPMWLFLGRAVKEARLAASAGSKANAKIEVPLALPRPTGQRSFVRLVSRVRERGCRTVVVLDEIDRAAPSVAQSALTLARRSLDMPGVVVVLAYVDELIRYKAFNPLIDTLQDLGSTMRAVLFDEGPDSGGPDRPGGDLSESELGSLREWEAWQHAEELQLASGGSDTSVSQPQSASASQSERAQGRDHPHYHDNQRLSEAVRLSYANASPARRRHLQRRFAERYLASNPIRLQRPADDDVAEMVVKFDTLSYLVAGLMGEDSLLPKTREAVKDTIKQALAT
ncbi:MAG: P-loop NTPase fold protein, partial [Pseudonocardiaceae bacterium]